MAFSSSVASSAMKGWLVQGPGADIPLLSLIASADKDKFEYDASEFCLTNSQFYESCSI